MVKAVTLAFCSIQQHSIGNIRARFGIRNLSQSPDIWKNSDGGISNFQISGQSIIKENCHNSRPSDDIHKKLGLVNKLDKRNKTTPKNLTTPSCQKIVTSLPSSQLTANLEQSGSRIWDG